MSESPTRPVSRFGIRRLVPVLVVVVAALLAATAIYRERAEVGAALDQIVWWALVLSFVACLTGLYCIFRAWSVLVEDTGQSLTRAQALQIYGVGQLGKYMPGGVWSVAMQAQMVRRYGGSRLRVASASVVILVLGVAVSLGAGSVLLPFSGEAARDRFWFAPLLALGAGLLLAPPLLNRVTALVGRLVPSGAATSAYSARGLLKAAGWLLVANVFFGLHIQVLGYELGAQGMKGFVLATAAYCLAVSLGLLFIPAPAGAGVRELVMVVVLATTMTTGAALVVALASRAVAIAADFALASSQLVRPLRPKRSPVFLTRRFPPSVGGMETLAAGVWRSVTSVRPDAVLIAHGGSNRQLLWWLPYAWVRLVWRVVTRRVEVVLVGDAPTFALVEPLLRLARVPRATMVLGLDVSYPNPLYRALVLPSLRRADQVIAISDATRDAAAAAGVSPERIVVVRLGVEAAECSEEMRAIAARDLRERLGLAPDAVVLLTLGRLVERKGARWFVTHVLPRLPEDVSYVVAGSGPDEDAIRRAGAAAGVSGRLHLTGAVDDAYRETLLCGADVFVQPNIPVAGDMEGFGLVTVEAAVRGTPVVASALEGLRDAVVDGRTGTLVAPTDVDAWTSTLRTMLGDPPSLRDLARRQAIEARQMFGEEQMGRSICASVGINPEPDGRT